MRRRRRSQEDEADIDLTPMLDVVFILLIFFIVTSSFVRESGIEIVRPKAETGKSQSTDKNLFIAISSNNAIWIDRQEVSVATIRDTIEKMKVDAVKKGAVIQADQGADTDMLIKVMDQLRLAGIENIIIATEQGK